MMESYGTYWEQLIPHPLVEAYVSCMIVTW
jgi:hypothetical protein